MCTFIELCYTYIKFVLHVHVYASGPKPFFFLHPISSCSLEKKKMVHVTNNLNVSAAPNFMTSTIANTKLFGINVPMHDIGINLSRKRKKDDRPSRW